MSTRDSKTRLREGSLLEEMVDRDGDWSRDFTSRAIIWPIFEHWAAENRYRLIAMRGNRRLYQKGDRPSGMISFLDIRQDGSRVRWKVWIQVGWLSRLCRGFLLKAKQIPDPSGYLGVRYRRRRCHEFNDLLDRLKQPPILHSQGFHWADLDVSTMGLLAMALLCTGLYTHGAVSRLPWSWRQAWNLESLELLFAHLGWPSLGVVFCGLTIVGVHHFFVLRKLPWSWVRPLSAVVGGLLLIACSYSVARYTRGKLPQAHLVTHCLVRADMESCFRAWDNLSESERLDVHRRMKRFYQEVVKRPAAPSAGVR